MIYPSRLWSLKAMLDLKAAPYARAVAAICTLYGLLFQLRKQSPAMLQQSVNVAIGDFSELTDAARTLRQTNTALELAGAARAAERLESQAAKEKLTGQTLITLLEQAICSHSDGIESINFYVLNATETGLYEGKPPRFGSDVERAFPADVGEDIDEAAKCLAFARYTAAVFHLMRVLEHGTAKFAGMLGVQPIDSRGKDKNWQNFLDEVNKKISKLPTQDARTKELAGISANLYNVKLAWRNEVMHPKQTYTPEEAREVYDSTKAFMRNLAETTLTP